MDKLALFRFIAALALTFAASAQTNPHVTGFFTNMKYVADSGDVLGMEVWIVYARHGYWATVQLAEGFPEPPVVVRVEVSGPKISFDVPDPADEPDHNRGRATFRFMGAVNRTGLVGTFLQQRVILKRTKSYWQWPSEER